MDVERWTIKAERKRFDALELCWRRFFRILWNARRSNQLILKEINGGNGALWMWAGLSCYLSSGDGYVGELLELQPGCEGPFEDPDVRCD